MNKRYRLVTETVRDGQIEEHTSSVILTEDEAYESLAIEAELMLSSGWKIRTQTRNFIRANLDRPDGTIRRTIRFRESTHEQDEL